MSYSSVGQLPTSFAVPAGPGGVFSGLGQIGGAWNWYFTRVLSSGEFGGWFYTDAGTASLLARCADGRQNCSTLFLSGGAAWPWHELAEKSLTDSWAPRIHHSWIWMSANTDGVNSAMWAATKEGEFRGFPRVSVFDRYGQRVT